MRARFALFILVLLPAFADTQTRWYPSDSLGAWSETSRGAPEPGKGWWLGVSIEADMQKQLLFRDGTETQQRWIEFDSARRPVQRRTFVDGVITSEMIFQTGTSAVQSETVYRQGEVSSVIRNTWGSSGLLSRHVEDAAGTWLWDDRLFRYPDGRLRRLERTGPQGALAQISWSSSGKGTPEVWIVDEDLLASGKHKVVSLTPEGLREDLWLQTELLSSRVTTDLPDGTSRLRETLPGTGQVTDRLSDSQGRLVSETISFKEQGVQTTYWTWDDQDRVVHEETSIRGGWETADFLYSEPGTTVIEKRRLGVLTSRETRIDGEKTLVELFDKGQKFLEEVWSEGKKTVERYFQNDQMVRERKR